MNFCGAKRIAFAPTCDTTKDKSGAKRARAALKLVFIVFGLGVLGVILAIAYGVLKYQLFGG